MIRHFLPKPADPAPIRLFVETLERLTAERGRPAPRAAGGRVRALDLDFRPADKA